VDFIQPGYLGSQEHFIETYEPNGENAEGAQRIARRRLSAKLRPLLLRRMKKHVAKDCGPHRAARDCELGDEQRKLYLAELRRSREQIMQTVAQQGLNQSKIHVLAALTRLRQVCCHPKLVATTRFPARPNAFELLDPLLARAKGLVFSHRAMLQLLEKECAERNQYAHPHRPDERPAGVVNAFQSDANPGVFLLSLRAAGRG